MGALCVYVWVWASVWGVSACERVSVYSMVVGTASRACDAAMSTFAGDDRFQARPHFPCWAQYGPDLGWRVDADHPCFFTARHVFCFTRQQDQQRTH